MGSPLAPDRIRDVCLLARAGLGRRRRGPDWLAIRARPLKGRSLALKADGMDTGRGSRAGITRRIDGRRHAGLAHAMPATRASSVAGLRNRRDLAEEVSREFNRGPASP